MDTDKENKEKQTLSLNKIDTNTENKQKQPLSKKKKGCLIAIIIVVVITIIGALLSHSDNNGSTSTNTQTTSNEKADTNTAWVYSSDTNQMNNEVTLYAENSSPTELDFDFPYEGGSTYKLTIRETNGKDEVMLSLNNSPALAPENKITLKFDDKQPFSVSFNESADGGTDVVFLNSSQKIINEIKQSKKLKMELTIFENGNHIIEFNIADLKWK
jgi:uncharacterized protein YxeA